MDLGQQGLSFPFLGFSMSRRWFCLLSAHLKTQGGICQFISLFTLFFIGVDKRPDCDYRDREERYWMPGMHNSEVLAKTVNQEFTLDELVKIHDFNAK